MAVNITMAVPKIGDYLGNELETRSVSVRAGPFSLLEKYIGNW